MKALMKPILRCIRSNLGLLRSERGHLRRKCRLEAKMTLIDSEITLDGLVLDISERGCLFRPPQRYLVDRAKCSVRIVIGETELLGTIVNTNARGYGVELEYPPSDDQKKTSNVTSIQAGDTIG